MESGSRAACEVWLKWLRETHPRASVDLLTCFEGEPLHQNQLQAVYVTSSYNSPAARSELAQEFTRNRYDFIAILSTDEPIMTKWKWYLVWKLPLKVMLVNESGDWVWLDRTHWSIVRHFIAVRTGLAGSGALTQPMRILAFPFVLAFLVSFALWVHARRALRMRFRSA